VIELPDHSFGHIEFGISTPEPQQVAHDVRALAARKDLWIAGAALRREDAEPDLPHLRLRRPELHEIFQVS
jgi:hypothetical protein